MKARLAVTLGKTYRQEGELSWGYLTPAGARGRGFHRPAGEPPARGPRARRPPARGGPPPDSSRVGRPWPRSWSRSSRTRRIPSEACARFLDLPFPLLLESAVRSERLGRFSYLAADPWLVLRSKGAALEWHSRGGRRALGGRPFRGAPDRSRPARARRRSRPAGLPGRRRRLPGLRPLPPPRAAARPRASTTWICPTCASASTTGRSRGTTCEGERGSSRPAFPSDGAAALGASRGAGPHGAGETRRGAPTPAAPRPDGPPPPSRPPGPRPMRSAGCPGSPPRSREPSTCGRWSARGSTSWRGTSSRPTSRSASRPPWTTTPSRSTHASAIATRRPSPPTSTSARRRS